MGNPRLLGHVSPIALGGTITTVAIGVAWKLWRRLDESMVITAWEDEIASAPRTDALEAWQEIHWYGPATET